jgi:uncharacterized membrane protein YphA (DoxX/SURF4 family)
MASTSRRTTIIAAVLGVVMIGAGMSKLVGESHQVADFALWGLPPWFRMLVGTFEVIGGLLLAVPATSPVGSLVLSTIMVGGLWTHIAHAEWPRVIAPMVLLTVFLLIFRWTVEQALRLVAGGVAGPGVSPSGPRPPR